MSIDPRGPAYGEMPSWSPERPRFRPGRVVLSWLVAAGALLIAAWIVPGVHVQGFLGALAASAVIALLNALLPPIVAALRLPFMVAARLPARALPRRGDAAGRPPRSCRSAITVDSFGWALARRADRGRRHDRARGDPRHERRRHLHASGSSSGSPSGRASRCAPTSPGIIFLEIDGLALPVLRRAMRDGNAPEMARWLAGGHAPARRVGDRPLVADRSEPGRDPARLERRHPRVPLGREGDGDDDDLLGAGRLRGDRAPPRDRERPADRRRREPRQPPLGRGGGGHPHRQPDGGREAGEPRLPRVLRQRVQRHARARAVRLGGDPRAVGVAAGGAGATCARAGIAAGSTRSCARRCASSSAT